MSKMVKNYSPFMLRSTTEILLLVTNMEKGLQKMLHEIPLMPKASYMFLFRRTHI